jgi:hypothetical protein
MLRRLLIALQLFVALGALGGGIWGTFFPRRMPVDDWFKRGPFSSSVIPGMILLVVVGGSCFAAAAALLRRHPLAWLASLASGVILMVWIVVQVLIIGGGHVLQYLYFGLGALMTGLSATLAWTTRTVPQARPVGGIESRGGELAEPTGRPANGSAR